MPTDTLYPTTVVSHRPAFPIVVQNWQDSCVRTKPIIILSSLKAKHLYSQHNSRVVATSSPATTRVLTWPVAQCRRHQRTPFDRWRPSAKHGNCFEAVRYSPGWCKPVSAHTRSHPSMSMSQSRQETREISMRRSSTHQDDVSQYVLTRAHTPV